MCALRAVFFWEAFWGYLDLSLVVMISAAIERCEPLCRLTHLLDHDVSVDVPRHPE